MKIVNIFGLVVAVHVAVLILVFAIPGCRSTRSSEAATASRETAPASPANYSSAVQPVREMSASDLNPPVAPRSAVPSSFDPNAAAVSSSGTRFSPQRPGGSSAAASGSVSPAPSVTPAPLQYTVTRGDSLWTIAKKHGTTVRELAGANNLRSDATLKLGQNLTIPGRTAEVAAGASSTINSGLTSAARSASPAPTSADNTSYVVRGGDTLGAIARRHNTSVAAIKAMNNLRSDMVRVGDALVIPGASSTTASASPAPAPTPATTTPAPAAGPAVAPAALARAGGGAMKHVVVPGETLGSIARRYNARLGDLAMANNITDPSRVRPGQELIIPGAQAPAGTATKAPVPTQYTPSFEQNQPPAGVIYTEDADNVPVIRVEENVPTIRVEPAPEAADQKSTPPIFR